MSTSLREQLERLKVPQTAILTRDKKRASLLFDPKEAANLNRETVFQIGLDGLEELVGKNPIFSQFENTLFADSSKDFERSVHNVDVNRKLDNNIRRFLLLLSPYFLMNCSHKALEWLVNRYHIHEFNREDFIMLILPYHETNIFVRALQLLSFRDVNDKWYWLKVLQKPGVHLTKKTLLNHAANDVYFVKFVSDMVLSVKKEHQNPQFLTVIFNFYCATITGALEYSHKVSEAQVSQILPTLLKGLFSQVPDFCAAAFVIGAKLLQKAQLEEKALKSFCKKVTGVRVVSLKTEAMLFLVILYQSQRHFKNMPESSVNNLVVKEWVPDVLSSLKKSGCYIMPLMEVFCKELLTIGVRNEDISCRKFLLKILNAIELESTFVGTFLNLVLDVIDPDKNYLEETEIWLSEILTLLEKSNPEPFDEEIKNIMKLKGGSGRQKSLQKIFNRSLIRGNYDIFEKLYHPNPEFRKQAITYIVKNYERLVDKERELIKTVFVDRLADEDVSVVVQVLNISPHLLIKVVGEKVLRDSLVAIIKKYRKYKTKWQEAVCKALEVLCSGAVEWDFKLFLVILPLLFPVSKNDLKLARTTINSSCGKRYETIKNLQKYTKCNGYEQFFEQVFNNIKFSEGLNALLENLETIPDETLDATSRFLICLLLSNTTPDNCPLDVGISVLHLYLKYIDKVSIVNDTNSVLNHMLAGQGDKINLQGVLHCLKQTVIKAPKSVSKTHAIDFSDANGEFYPLVTHILLKICYNKTHEMFCLRAFDNFLTHFSVDLRTNVEIALNLIITENHRLDDEIRLICLKYLMMLLKIEKCEELFENIYHINLQAFLDFSSIIVPFLLGLLISANKNIRAAGFRIIKFLTSKTKKTSSNYWLFLKQILEHEKEVILDHEQTPLITYNALFINDETDEVIKKTLHTLVTIASGALKHPIYLNAAILKILSYMNNIQIFSKTSKLAVDLLISNENLDAVKSNIVYKNILRFEASIASEIKLDSEIWRFLSEVLKRDTPLNLESTDSSSAVLALNQISCEFYELLSNELKLSLLDLIVSLTTVTKSPNVVASVSYIFKHIDLDVGLIVGFIKKMCEVQSSKQKESRSKRRLSVVPTADILDTPEWKKGIAILEFVQDKKKIKNTLVLLPFLFDVLKRCLDFDEQALVEYPKQLLLSAILHCCNKCDVALLSENIFNMELIVQCIRATQNPQTHHHALLLLAYTAKLIPDQVLHNMMSIFTFMGSSVLRQDDAYSFQIITRIIDTVIPILTTSDEQESICKVLRVFVDALLDVAEHRRMPLYLQLLNKVNPENNLYLFLLLVFEAHIVHGSVEKSKLSKQVAANIEEVPRRLDIAANLCHIFSPSITIKTCIKVVEYLNKLPVEKTNTQVDHSKCVPFNITSHTAKQFRHYKYTIVVFIGNLLASSEFVTQVALLDDDKMLELEPLFKVLIVNVLSNIQQISKIAEKNQNTPQTQYWKVILHHTFDILDAINALLTPQMFLLVVRGLMVHDMPTVRRRAMELLNTKLQCSPQFFEQCDDREIYALLSPLAETIKSIENLEEHAEQEVIVQTALLSLKLVVKLMAPKNPEKFVQVLHFITNLMKLGQAKNNILASAVLCLGELCANLRAHAISSLNKFMPALLKVLKKQRHQATPDLLLLSTVLTVQKILESLPLFLSSYLVKMLTEISLITSKFGCSSDDQKTAPLVNKLIDVRDKIASVIPARVLIPAVEDAYADLVKKSSYSAIEPLMKLLAEHLAQLGSQDVQANLPELTAFFLAALQFRSDNLTSREETNLVESHVVDALTSLVLKLSENTFRPLYYRLYDWAIRGEGKTERVITFYGLSSGLAERLKGLFVLFAGHFVNNAANLLDACNIKNERLYFEDDDKNALLLEAILKTLHSVFLYDGQRFVNKERFEVLMQPLADQLENTVAGLEGLEKRSRHFLTPCIVQFAVAAADDSLWKQLNYQILLKLRHSQPKIRLVALECFASMAKKLGEDFLPLLPETIPFLAELLEDEDETVESSCRKSVQELEKVLGEPLQKYF